MTKYGLLSLRTIVGAIDDRGRLPVQSVAGTPSLSARKEKSVISLFSKNPPLSSILIQRHFQW